DSFQEAPEGPAYGRPYRVPLMSSGAEPRRRRPLAVTMGDPAGIGLEITLRAWLERSDKGLTPFVVFADKDALAERTRLLGLAVPLAVVNAPGEAPDVFGAALPVLHSPLPVRPRPGDPDAANAAGIIHSIDAATASVVRGEASAIVTNPIAKRVLRSADFPFPGHTEFLAALAERHTGKPARPVMMLASHELRVVPLTVHGALAEVPKAITRALIFETVRTTYAALRRDFGISAPRI